MIRTCRFFCLNNDMSEQSLLLIFLHKLMIKIYHPLVLKTRQLKRSCRKGKIPIVRKHNQSLNLEAYEKMRMARLLEEIKHHDLHYVYL